MITRRSTSEDTNRAAIIDTVISCLRRGEDRKYFIGLVGYYIEGIAYGASGLSVDLGATQDIQQIDGGFMCTAIISPNLLEPSIVRANGIIEMNIGGRAIELVRVRLEAKLDDIWSVAEFIDGKQHNLFLDPNTLKSRLKVPFGLTRVPSE